MSGAVAGHAAVREPVSVTCESVFLPPGHRRHQHQCHCQPGGQLVQRRHSPQCAGSPGKPAPVSDPTHRSPSVVTPAALMLCVPVPESCRTPQPKSITLEKGCDGLGFSIVGGYGSPHGDLPIYVKTVFSKACSSLVPNLTLTQCPPCQRLYSASQG